ncbi:MAG: tetratricopeptide repeat protein [Burkholderiales bacterium]
MPTKSLPLVFVVAAALLLAWPHAALADANVTAPPVNNTDFDLGADALKAKDWDRAVYHLAIAAKAEPANADVQNLLGYAYRNQKKFDLAFVHYNEALKLDPKHRGAHEYIGEAYVLTGNKAKAGEHLAALERICGGRSCEEYQDLARAIAQAK